MPKDIEPTSKNLEKKLDLLIKRFDEQKGIIDSYVKRERDWKKDKVLHQREVKKLEKILKKYRNE
jgi:hypothetical protein|tara:strand:+ start:689 stop:883 length:195 start_codon:yes stop_codon:yes gene_type:complete